VSRFGALIAIRIKRNNRFHQRFNRFLPGGARSAAFIGFSAAFASVKFSDGGGDVRFDQPGDGLAIMRMVEEEIRITQLGPVEAPVQQRRMGPAGCEIGIGAQAGRFRGGLGVLGFRRPEM